MECVLYESLMSRMKEGCDLSVMFSFLVIRASGLLTFICAVFLMVENSRLLQGSDARVHKLQPGVQLVLDVILSICAAEKSRQNENRVIFRMRTVNLKISGFS